MMYVCMYGWMEIFDTTIAGESFVRKYVCPHVCMYVCM
jgi:hypothetical protein